MSELKLHQCSFFKRMTSEISGFLKLSLRLLNIFNFFKLLFLYNTIYCLSVLNTFINFSVWHSKMYINL